MEIPEENSSEQNSSASIHMHPRAVLCYSRELETRMKPRVYGAQSILLVSVKLFMAGESFTKPGV